MSGALNESYSDIFGVIVSNYEEDDFSRWRWEIGEKLSAEGCPLRDLSRPSRFGQPEHMRHYRADSLPPAEANDHGFVHANSGIHNLAAHRLLTARNGGAFLFDKQSAAVLFYAALTQLTPNATFSDSRRAVDLVARTLYRNDSTPLTQARLRAVADAFAGVGIVAL